VEKNRKPGVKILMSGGTRCNLTHATDARGIVAAYGPPGRFLHSALAALSPQDMVDLIEAEGVATKVEQTGKIFPVSDRALDVQQALLRRLARSGCVLQCDTGVTRIEKAGDGLQVAAADRSWTAGKVILTTGGQSYPGSGTTGDGYGWAAAIGHTIVPPLPALVPVTVRDAWVPPLRGITVPDVRVRVIEPRDSEKPAVLAERRGSLLFTHFGLSGPVILDVSREVSRHSDPLRLLLDCDFLPGVAKPELDASLRPGQGGPPAVAAILAAHLPRRLAETFLDLAGQPAERKLAELSRGDRGRLVDTIKRCRIGVTGTLGFKKAEVTAGGVALVEVDSRTMQSRLVEGLYLAGEILDLDGPIGGYNFQAAFSTGWLAGESV
jgi:predicted Rossmann fold flavoprotein